jgi:hypothetical protein
LLSFQNKKAIKNFFPLFLSILTITSKLMNTKKRIGLLTFIIVACLMACNTNNNNKKETEKAAVSGRHAELKLPDGFSATIVADSLGPLRHLVIATNGDVYTNFSTLQDGKGIVILHDTNSDGILDKIKSFANYPGTGIAIKNGYLYSDSISGVF